MIVDGSEYRNFLFVPYKECGRTKEGSDCWGLIRLILIEKINVYFPEYSNEAFATDKIVSKEIGNQISLYGWKRIKENELKEPWDVVILKIFGADQWHIATMISDKLCITMTNSGVIVCN